MVLVPTRTGQDGSLHRHTARSQTSYTTRAPSVSSPSLITWGGNWLISPRCAKRVTQLVNCASTKASTISATAPPKSSSFSTYATMVWATMHKVHSVVASSGGFSKDAQVEKGSRFGPEK